MGNPLYNWSLGTTS